MGWGGRGSFFLIPIVFCCFLNVFVAVVLFSVCLLLFCLFEFCWSCLFFGCCVCSVLFIVVR